MNNYSLIKNVIDCLSEDITKYKNEITTLRGELNKYKNKNNDESLNKILKPEQNVMKTPTVEVKEEVKEEVKKKTDRSEYQKKYQAEYRKKKRLELEMLKKNVVKNNIT